LIASAPTVNAIGIVVVAFCAASATGVLVAAMTATRRLQLGRKIRQPGVIVVRPAILDRDVPALGVSGFAQALAKSGHEVRGIRGSRGGKIPDQRHSRGFLRAGGKRHGEESTRNAANERPSIHH
jgi:hypothetical protein